MKIKSILIVFLWAILACFFGCDPNNVYPVTVDFDELKERLWDVEIVFVDADNVERLYVLQESEIPAFLEDYFALSFCERGPAGSLSGFGIKFVYTDGSFSVMTSDMGYEYKANGEYKGHGITFDPSCEKEAYQIMGKYLTWENIGSRWEDIDNFRDYF